MSKKTKEGSHRRLELLEKVLPLLGGQDLTNNPIHAAVGKAFKKRKNPTAERVARDQGDDHGWTKMKNKREGKRRGM